MSQYIVLDLEWNQSSRGKEGSVNCLPFEIIEIGAVKLDENFRTVSEFHRLIRPRVYRQMHFKISEVTHMSMEELEHEGLKFEDAVEEFIGWCGDDYVLCTWGNMDLTELQRNMVYHGLEIPFPFPLFYYDVQKIYSLLHSDGKQKDSLDRVVEELGLLEGRPFHPRAGRRLLHWQSDGVCGFWADEGLHFRGLLPSSRVPGRGDLS